MKTRKNPLAAGIRHALIAGCVIAAPLGMPAFAQDADEATVKLDRVEVTGSRIRRVDAETASPVFVIDRSGLERSGAVTVGDLIQEIPAIAGAATNPSVNNGGGDGASTVSLRGLGEDRTLLLLNGRRMVTQDINTIPVAMIERIEVLKDGASAIYGSDAIGGVVNFITRKDFDGAQSDVNYGIAGEEDGERIGTSATFGMTGERGHAIISMNYNEQKPVLAADRDFSAFALYLSSGVVSRAGSSSTPRGRYSLPGSVATANGLGSCIGGNGFANVTRIEGRPGTAPGDFRCYVGGETDSFNYQAAGNVVLTPQERYGVAFSGTYELVEGLEAFIDVHTQNTTSAGIIAPLPFFSDFDGIALSGQSIYNPFRTTINGRYRILGLGNRSYSYETDMQEITSGLQGDIGESSWRWNAGFTYGKIAQENQDAGYIDYGRLGQALGPSFIQNGVARCGTLAAPIAGCTPINFFNQPDPATAEGQAQIAALEALALPVRDNTDTSLRNFTINFDGDLFDLPAGTMSAAFGAEYRKQSLVFSPDAIKFINSEPFGCGISSEACADPTRGDTTTKEIYGELYIPIIDDAPWADSLAVTLGSRWSDYDSFGDTTNSKIGIEWRVMEDFLFRTTYAEVFRAPTINDLFQGARITNPVYSDPCNGQPLSCVGLPNRPGVTFSQGLGQTNALLGGNPDLRPETGDVFTWGFVYSPGWLEGFSTTVDVWRVDLTDTIQTLGTQPILNECFESGGTSPLCDLFTRNPTTGDVFLVSDLTQNVGNTKTNGVDVGFRYTMDTEWGRFRTSIDSTYIDSFQTDGVENAGTFLPSSKGGLGNYSRWRSLAALSWNLNNFEAQWTMRYIDGFQVGSFSSDGDCADNGGRGTVGDEGCVFFRGAVTYHNFQVGYSLPEWKTKVQFGIDNAFDKQPPVLYQNNSLNGNIDERTHDPVGRYFWMNATVTF